MSQEELADRRPESAATGGEEENTAAPSSAGHTPVGPDHFYQGIISKLFPRNNMGMIRTFTGREVPFSYQLVVLVGAILDTKDLAEGMQVGFDLGWTSEGLRVTRIKTYQESSELGVEGREPSVKGSEPESPASDDPSC